jgi:hypothetical protein
MGSASPRRRRLLRWIAGIALALAVLLCAPLVALWAVMHMLRAS